MKNYLFIIIIALVVQCQYITIGDPCKCNELFTQQECICRGFCIWNPIQMTCDKADIQQTTSISTSPLKYTKSHSISLFCDSFSQIECLQQNGCSWSQNRCVMFTGCSVYTKYNDEDCQSISKQCYTDGVRCIELGECDSYIYTVSCKISKSGKYCRWNQQNRSCQKVESCSELPKKLQSDYECRQQLNFCTVKEGDGCEESGASCKDQKSEKSCVTDRYQSVNCFWTGNECRDKNCENALETLTTDQECKQFLSYCTTKKNGGCTIRKQCKDADVEQACTIDNLGYECFWDGNACNERLCENAPATYTTNEQCQSISKQCISSGGGCMNNYACSSAISQEYCQYDSVGNQCIWTTYCKQKKCDEADQSYITDEQCQQYMNTCISKINGGCQVKTCETASLNYNTNEQCQQYKQDCILKQNGGCKQNTICLNIDIEEACKKDKDGKDCYWNQQDKKCYQLSLCALIKNKENCIKDIDNIQCQWLEPLFHNQKEQCVNKSCNTAPLYYTTYNECNEYYKNCIPKINGGCKQINLCEEIEFMDSCKLDINNNICKWEQNKCRQQQCNDIQGLTYQKCNSQLNTCTVGQNEYCSTMKLCEEYNNVLQCVQGTNGQCLWIDNYRNFDNKLGGCFQFDKCQSLKWKTDAECKMASSNCTTDGQQCVPITLCQITNTNGGCIMGTDGECIQSVPSLNSQKPKICSKFINCSNAYYLTHEECQQAHTFCTTNGQTGCRDLNQCQYYFNIQSCHINNLGIQRDEQDNITSTGKCIWNNEKSFCRDLQCEDLLYQTEYECQQQLYNCTSNGQKCVEKQSCQSYLDQEICNTRKGIDGSCFWDQQNLNCRLKQCSEILYGNTQQLCNEVENCISDGNKCVQKLQCQEYKNQISCSNYGTDGICIWENNQCSLMTSCNSANNDKNACLLANDRCFWNQSQCNEHTCQSYFYQENQCSYFYTWDKTKYNICKIIQGTCQAIDAKTLTAEECYSYSLYIYSWNPISNKCVQCSRVMNRASNTTKNESTQSQPTQWQYILTTIAGFFALTL